MKRKILIFLYISLERRQNRTTNKTKFKALLHKNKLGIRGISFREIFMR